MHELYSNFKTLSFLKLILNESNLFSLDMYFYTLLYFIPKSIKLSTTDCAFYTNFYSGIYFSLTSTENLIKHVFQILSIVKFVK